MTDFPTFKRTHFFSGRILSAADLMLEQEYHREKLRLHNRHLHGWGIVDGLNVSSDSSSIHVAPGIALDCLGNEILVSKCLALDQSAIPGVGTTVFISIRYFEKESDQMVGSASPGTQGDTIEESFNIVFEQANSNRGHRRKRGMWRACGAAHPITIARLKKVSSGWRLDRRYHPPSVH